MSMASSALRFLTASSAVMSSWEELVGRSTPRVAVTFTYSTRRAIWAMPAAAFELWVSGGPGVLIKTLS